MRFRFKYIIHTVCVAVVWVAIVFILLVLSGFWDSGNSFVKKSVRDYVDFRSNAYMGMLNLIKDDNGKLETYIDSLVQFNPTHVTNRFGPHKNLAYRYLARNYLDEGDYSNCVDYASLLVEFQTNSYENHILYGDCLLGLGQEKDAFDEYNQAWEINPLANGLLGKISTLLESGDYELSLSYVKGIYESYPLASQKLQFFFSSGGAEGFSADTMILSDGISANGRMHTYEFSIEGIVDGPILLFRIDPVQNAVDGLMVKIDKVVFKGDGVDNYIISDFSDWKLEHNISRLGGNTFAIDGEDPYMISPPVELIGYDTVFITLKIGIGL